MYQYICFLVLFFAFYKYIYQILNMYKARKPRQGNKAYVKDNLQYA